MLSDEEKQIIEKAFIIVNRYNEYSCIAIEKALGRGILEPFHEFTKRYAMFFNQNEKGIWDWGDMTFSQRKQARLMLLATFWELG